MTVFYPEWIPSVDLLIWVNFQIFWGDW